MMQRESSEHSLSAVRADVDKCLQESGVGTSARAAGSPAHTPPSGPSADLVLVNISAEATATDSPSAVTATPASAAAVTRFTAELMYRVPWASAACVTGAAVYVTIGDSDLVWLHYLCDEMGIARDDASIHLTVDASHNTWLGALLSARDRITGNDERVMYALQQLARTFRSCTVGQLWESTRLVSFITNVTGNPGALAFWNLLQEHLGIAADTVVLAEVSGAALSFSVGGLLASLTSPPRTYVLAAGHGGVVRDGSVAGVTCRSVRHVGHMHPAHHDAALLPTVKVTGIEGAVVAVVPDVSLFECSVDARSLARSRTMHVVGDSEAFDPSFPLPNCFGRDVVVHGPVPETSACDTEGTREYVCCGWMSAAVSADSAARQCLYLARARSTLNLKYDEGHSGSPVYTTTTDASGNTVTVLHSFVAREIRVQLPVDGGHLRDLIGLTPATIALRAAQRLAARDAHMSREMQLRVVMESPTLRAAEQPAARDARVSREMQLRVVMEAPSCFSTWCCC